MNRFSLSVFVLAFTMLLSACGDSSTSKESRQMGGAIQGTQLSLTQVVSTFAGSTASGSSNGPSTTARFNNPSGITTDGTNLFVADKVNHTIRKIVIASGTVTTLAGTVGSPGATDGVGTAAKFFAPISLTTDGTYLFVSDFGNHTIRKIVIATGLVSTLAGNPGFAGSTDGTGASARFQHPLGLTTDSNNIYVADSDNNLIRKVVISTGEVTTIAGAVMGSADGVGSTASFFYPTDITTDGTNLYVVDHLNSTVRKLVIATGTVTTLAGTAGNNGFLDGTGSAARFYYPQGISSDGFNLFITDCYSNQTIRKIVIATGEVTTVAGAVGIPGSTDGTGTSAKFGDSQSVTTDGKSLFVADTANNTIRKID